MDNWFVQFITNPTVGQSIMLIAATIAGGFALSKLKFKGVSLGVTWILFFGIALGQFEFLPLNAEILHFVKEFGLILFVYSIGLQVGPGFFQSFQNGGVSQNMLAVGIVVTGGILAYLLASLLGFDLPTVVGIMSGAVTNTPGLGAAQQTYTDLYAAPADVLSAGYAIAYPMGVVGVILACLFVHKCCRKSVSEDALGGADGQMEMFSIEVHNPACAGASIGSLKHSLGMDFVITRLYHTNQQYMEVPKDESLLFDSDRVFVVCNKVAVQKVEMCLGTRIDMDLSAWDLLDNQLVCNKMILTKTSLNGKTLGSLNLCGKFNVNISRIVRAGVSLFPSEDLKVVLGDEFMVVGNEQGVQLSANFIGNKKVELHEPFLIPIFLGIMVGVILGMIPFALPMVPIPVKLGLAGGPLIVAILMSRFGSQFGLVTYATHSAKKMLQEIGISLFLAAVGLSSGKIFFATLMDHGASWFLLGAAITLIPVILALVIGRFFCKLEAHQLMGLVSGGMTDPAALAFSNSITNGKASLSYATVYPLTMFMRILCAQILILLSV